MYYGLSDFPVTSLLEELSLESSLIINDIIVMNIEYYPILSLLIIHAHKVSLILREVGRYCGSPSRSVLANLSLPAVSCTFSYTLVSLIQVSNCIK